MLWRVSRPLRSRSKPSGFILPCQPTLADKPPPSGPAWLREIKFDGYRVIAPAKRERVQLWVRPNVRLIINLKKNLANRRSPGSA